MTLREAAEYAKVSTVTMRRWLTTGKVKAHKVVRENVELWEVSEDAVRDAIGGREPPRPTPPPSEPSSPSAELLSDVVRMLREQLAEKDKQISALLTTNARMNEQNADLQKRALPMPERPKERGRGWWPFRRRDEWE